MAAWITNYSLVDLSDQTQIVAQIECDEDSDLPGVNDFTGKVLNKGSTAHVIDGNTKYMLDSTGTWIRQDDAGRFNVYTRTETDILLRNEQIRTDGYLDRLFQYTKKNLLNVWGQNSQTINGILWTINNDGTIRASGTASADSVLYIWRNAFPPPVISEDIMITGLPAGASAATWNYVFTSSGVSQTITADTLIKASIAANTQRFALKVVNGQQNVDLTFSPMVIPANIYTVSPDFAPYAPTAAELYQLIRSYHP